MKANGSKYMSPICHTSYLCGRKSLNLVSIIHNSSANVLITLLSITVGILHVTTRLRRIFSHCLDSSQLVNLIVRTQAPIIQSMSSIIQSSLKKGNLQCNLLNYTSISPTVPSPVCGRPSARPVVFTSPVRAVPPRPSPLAPS